MAIDSKSIYVRDYEGCQAWLMFTGRSELGSSSKFFKYYDICLVDDETGEVDIIGTTNVNHLGMWENYENGRFCYYDSVEPIIEYLVGGIAY